MHKKTRMFLISSVFLFTSVVSAQLKTNLDIFYMLVDSSVSESVSHLPQSKDSVKLELNLGESYSIFTNRIMSNVYSAGKILTEDINTVTLNFVIDGASVVYGEIFRDGLFGEYYIERTIFLKGNYLIRNNSSYFNEYNFSSNDSIKYDHINSVESQSYNFTKGEVPAEPFFSGLLEPIVAIGAAALAVILFFTVRSK